MNNVLLDLQVKAQILKEAWKLDPPPKHKSKKKKQKKNIFFSYHPDS